MLSLEAPAPRSPAPAPACASDLTRVQRARAGDRGALREIYETHRRSVGRHLLALVHDRAAVDDLVQETFVTAFGQLGRYDGTSRLSTWLHGIALNHARNYLAKRRRRQRLLHAHPAGSGSAREQEAAADRRAREAQALDLLYAALDRLPREQREAFVLRIIEQRPLKEAAEILRAPVATVSYRARQAEARVREILAKQGIDP